MKARKMAKPHRSLQVRIDDLLEYEPLTNNQARAYESWDEGDNLILTGSAGTGKTFMGMYLGLECVLDAETLQDRLIVIRSMVPTRDMGFIPGTKEEKEDVYTAPYKAICDELFGGKESWNKSINTKRIEFQSTSYIRGVTIDNAVILVDEMQNLNFHELDSVITRVGKNSRIIFSGDSVQTDFKYSDDRSGIYKFISIVEQLKNFDIINFGWEDIVRSDFVRDYIMTKEMLNL